MSKPVIYVAAVSFCAFSLFTLNWYIETSIAAGTIVPALLTLLFAVTGLGALAMHHRALTRREAAREARYRAAETRARLAEERETYFQERHPWN